MQPRLTDSCVTLAAALTMSIFMTGCEEKKPSKMTLRPSAKIVFINKGQSRTVKIAAFDDKNIPFVRKPSATFEASTDGIVNIDSKDGSDAVLTPLSSGSTTITASAWDLSASVDIEVQLVGSVSFDEATPKKFKILSEKYQLIVHVKDDKGNPMKDPKINFSASDYCVKIDKKGLLFAQATGTCQVIADVNGKVARHTVEVY
jgi:hypothetical protein